MMKKLCGLEAIATRAMHKENKHKASPNTYDAYDNGNKSAKGAVAIRKLECRSTDEQWYARREKEHGRDISVKDVVKRIRCRRQYGWHDKSQTQYSGSD